MLQGKTALITGSTSGIGFAVAQRLASTGANIVLNGLGDAGEIEIARSKMESQYGVRVIYNPADMTKPAEIKAMVEGAVGQFGKVDVLVNNAGIQHVAAIDDFPVARWDAIIAINMSSVFHTTRAALPAMKSAGWGRIINIASSHGLVASPYKSAYVTAKHGVVGLTKTTALEVAQQGITCNAICPGYVLTPLVEKQIPDMAKAHGVSEDEVVHDVLLAPQPTRKFVGLDELGALVLYLCSEGAVSLTGAALPIDGGWTAH